MRIVLKQHFEELDGSSRIALGAVTIIERNIQRLTELSQTIRRKPRKNLSARPNRANRSAQVVMPKPAQFFFDKIKVETNVVRYKNGILRNIDNALSDFSKQGCVLHHFVRNASQMTNKWRNRTFWIHQRMKGVNDLPPIMAKDCDFSKASGAIYTAGSFNVDNTIHKRAIYGTLLIAIATRQPITNCTPIKVRL